MNHFDQVGTLELTKPAFKQRLLCAALIVGLAALSGCGSKEKKPGQTLVSVNGEEITVLQLNEELQRANVQVAQQEAASKQLLESLIDRQLLQIEAAKEKLDREPKIVQAIERAKAQIISQAYLQKKVGAQVRPTKVEIEAYFNQHPEFFTQRKQFDMKELVLSTKDLTDQAKSAIDAAKSLDDVATWLEANKVKFAHANLARSTSDLPPEMSAKLQAMPKGHLFIVKEGERSLIIAIADIKDSPVTLETASPQIDQFLFNKKNKDAADAELARLRAAAKIEYLNKPAAKPAASATVGAPVAAAPVAPAAPTAAAAPAASGSALDRGAAGLK